MNIKRSTTIFASIIATLLINNVSAECIYPKKNFVIPSGTNSTKEEMLEVMDKFKTLQADLKSYRSCLLAEEEAVLAGDAENKEELVSMIVKKHDGSIEEETAIADEWNEAVRAYNSQ
tara:strand:+ start:1026 stop:1379 length:354 start_codon:yes stop_codon:yes gene_type:complete